MHSWFSQLLFLVFPGKCIICKGPTHRRLDLCAGCQRDLPFNRPACWTCGLEHRGQDICDSCLKTPPIHSHCFALLRYEPPVDVLISQFKSSHRLVVGRVLGTLLAHAYQKQHLTRPDAWLPVPLHWRAHRRRGFNQAAEIAQILAHYSGVPCLTEGVHRVRHTPSQKQLDAAHRAQNISNAFRFEIDLSDRSVAIVDDVVTTGATVAELSRAALASGARDVQVVCLARTPRNRL